MIQATHGVAEPPSYQRHGVALSDIAASIR